MKDFSNLGSADTDRLNIVEFGDDPGKREDGSISFFVGAPWERQPGETNKAWGAFEYYLKMDSFKRTVVGAYRLKNGWKPDSKAAAPRAWREWYHKYRWMDRVTAYDAHKAKEANNAELEAIREMAKRRVEAYTTIMDIGLKVFEKADVENMSVDEARRFFRDIPSFIEAGAAGQRVELGQPQKSVDVNVRQDESKPQFTLESLEEIVASGLSSGYQFEFPPDE